MVAWKEGPCRVLEQQLNFAGSLLPEAPLLAVPEVSINQITGDNNETDFMFDAVEQLSGLLENRVLHVKHSKGEVSDLGNGELILVVETQLSER